MTEFDQLIQADYRRNVRAVFLFELLWGIGMPFSTFLTMVPAYLLTLGASKTLIGFAGSFFTITTPLQIISIYFFSRKGRKKAFFFTFFIAVGSWLIYALASLLFISDRQGTLLIAVFIPVLIVFTTGLNMGNPLYFGILTDVVPRNKRGKLFGIRTFGMGAGGFAMTFLCYHILSSWPEPLNYQISFVIGTGVWAVACISILGMKDHHRLASKRPKQNELRALKRQTVIMWQNPNQRIFLFFYLLIVMATALAAFIIPYSQEELGIESAEVSRYTLLYLICISVLGIFLGKIADRFGYKSVLAVEAAALLAVFLILLSSKSVPASMLAYGLYGIPLVSNLFILTNLSVEFNPRLDAGVMTTIANIIILPVAAIISPLAGLIIDLNGSYFDVFLSGALFSGLTLLGIISIIQEPRRKRLYVIKRVPHR